MSKRKEEIKEILPEKPRKISEDFPEDYEIFTDEAKISVDGHGQHFVRFPKSLEEHVDFKNSKAVFSLKIPTDKKKKVELAIKITKGGKSE